MVVSSSSSAPGGDSSSNGLSSRGRKLNHWHYYFEGIIRKQLAHVD